jgi:hypothetical protein
MHIEPGVLCLWNHVERWNIPLFTFSKRLRPYVHNESTHGGMDNSSWPDPHISFGKREFLTKFIQQSPCWEANSHSPSQEVPSLLWNLRFFTMFTKAHHWSLSWARRIYPCPILVLFPLKENLRYMHKNKISVLLKPWVQIVFCSYCIHWLYEANWRLLAHLINGRYWRNLS